MKFHTLFFLKIRKNVARLSSAAVVIGALRFNDLSWDMIFSTMCHFDKCRLRGACAASFLETPNAV